MQRVGPPPGAPPGPPPLPPGPLPPDVSRGPAINIVGWVGASICTVFVLLRLYSRHFITRTLGWSDAIIVFAQVLNIIATALATVSVHYGTGRHAVHIPLENIEPALFYGAIVRPFSITSYILPKLSVALLIISLMGTQKTGVWFLWSVIVVLFITSILSFIMLFAQCNPPDHIWKPMEPAMCYPTIVLDSITYVAGSWSAFTDLILAVYPVWILRNLQVKKSKKISIMIIMGLGFFAMIAAIAKTTQLSANNSPDAPYELFWLFITTYVETDLVIIAACAPTLPKLFMRLMGKDTELPTGQSGYGSKKVGQGYKEFDSENSHSVPLDTIKKKVVISQNSQMV
ncbi:unnamed protein product [Periconia digitata]|uniref:Rhodopsin domain-containing protein n=1 Tax=Periconia digitata TaxID=1303443 RepID=A0A9W4UH54_9PLEO|nr:unnamed protein product [Periconia digitata]